MQIIRFYLIFVHQRIHKMSKKIYSLSIHPPPFPIQTTSGYKFSVRIICFDWPKYCDQIRIEPKIQTHMKRLFVCLFLKKKNVKAKFVIVLKWKCQNYSNCTKWKISCSLQWPSIGKWQNGSNSPKFCFFPIAVCDISNIHFGIIRFEFDRMQFVVSYSIDQSNTEYWLLWWNKVLFMHPEPADCANWFNILASIKLKKLFPVMVRWP